MKLWESVLYPYFLATVKGELYSLMTDTQIKDELTKLSFRAVSAFKFPKVSLAYDCYYVDAFDNIVEEEDDWVAQYWYFISDDISYREIDVLVSWMKAFWVENQLSSADNFDNMYTDANIKTFSPGNALDKYLKTYTTFKDEALQAEMRYSRTNTSGTPAIEGLNDDD